MYECMTTNDHACIYIGRCIARLSKHFFIKARLNVFLGIVYMLIGQMRCNARNSEHVFRPGDNTWKATS